MALGADTHIDYQTEKFWEVVKDVDFVFDAIGGEALEHSVGVTKPGGTIISIIPATNEGLQAKAKEKNMKLSLWGMQVNGDDLSVIAGLMSKHIIKPRIAQTYPFTTMTEAHTQVETRRTAGKIVLTV